MQETKSGSILRNETLAQTEDFLFMSYYPGGRNEADILFYLDLVWCREVVSTYKTQRLFIHSNGF